MAYFADKIKEFGAVHLALASYNAGERAVRRWILQHPGLPQDEFIDDISYPETQQYVKKLLGTAEDYRRLYGERGVRPLTPDGGADRHDRLRSPVKAVKPRREAEEEGRGPPAQEKRHRRHDDEETDLRQQDEVVPTLHVQAHRIEGDAVHESVIREMTRQRSAQRRQSLPGFPIFRTPAVKVRRSPPSADVNQCGHLGCSARGGRARVHRRCGLDVVADEQVTSPRVDRAMMSTMMAIIDPATRSSCSSRLRELRPRRDFGRDAPLRHLARARLAF
jgi:hypothetical protein